MPRVWNSPWRCTVLIKSTCAFCKHVDLGTVEGEGGRGAMPQLSELSSGGEQHSHAARRRKTTLSLCGGHAHGLDSYDGHVVFAVSRMRARNPWHGSVQFVHGPHISVSQPGTHRHVYGEADADGHTPADPLALPRPPPANTHTTTHAKHNHTHPPPNPQHPPRNLHTRPNLPPRRQPHHKHPANPHPAFAYPTPPSNPHRLLKTMFAAGEGGGCCNSTHQPFGPTRPPP